MPVVSLQQQERHQDVQLQSTSLPVGCCISPYTAFSFLLPQSCWGKMFLGRHRGAENKYCISSTIRNKLLVAEVLCFNLVTDSACPVLIRLSAVLNTQRVHCYWPLSLCSFRQIFSTVAVSQSACGYAEDREEITYTSCFEANLELSARSFNIKNES